MDDIASSIRGRTLRVLHVEPLAEWIRAVFDRTAHDAGLKIVWGGELDRAELARAAERVHVLVTAMRRVDGDLIRAAKALRLVQVQGRAPWAVDTEAAAAGGVPVSILPHRGAIAVAEQAIALMLGLYRKVVPGHLGTRNADYRILGVEPVRTTERKIAFNWLGYDDVLQLHGRMLGLVGLGGIGLEVARRARAFDMEVVYHKRSPLPRRYEQMAGVRYLPLRDLLADSDVVSLHAPHTPHTDHIIDAGALSVMKRDAILVNTARGGLVDEAALLDALRAGRIAGAGLDVFLDEPLPEGNPLLGAPNVLFSPHVGGGTGGGQVGMARDVVANLAAVREGGELRGVVGAGTASP